MKAGMTMRLVLTALLAMTTAAAAHDAPSGWSYEKGCCDNRDCRPIPGSWVKEGHDGYVMLKTGEKLSYGDLRVKQSQDSDWHWCTIRGADDSRTLCLYTPQRLF